MSSSGARARQCEENFPQAKPARWAGVYLQGLLLDGDRKSIEPLSRRVGLPPGLQVKDPEQALQQFVNQSPWDDQQVLKRYRAVMAKALIVPDVMKLINPGTVSIVNWILPASKSCSIGALPR